MRVYTGYQGPSRTQMAHGNQGDVERGQLVANGWVTRRGTTQRKREAGLVAAELSLAPRLRERGGAAVSRTPLPAWGAASPRQPGGQPRASVSAAPADVRLGPRRWQPAGGRRVFTGGPREPAPAATGRARTGGEWVSPQHMCCSAPFTFFKNLTIYYGYIVIF